MEKDIAPHGGHTGRLLSYLFAAVLSLSAVPGLAFQTGTSTGSLTVGAGSALDQNYTVIGARLGYFYADGLEFSIAGEIWRDNKPNIYKFTPEARYVWFAAEPVKPYVGAFLSRTMYSGLPDRNTYGIKGGGYFAVSPNANVSLGVVYERISSCNQAVYRDCSEVYPEAAFHVRF